MFWIKSRESHLDLNYHPLDQRTATSQRVMTVLQIRVALVLVLSYIGKWTLSAVHVRCEARKASFHYMPDMPLRAAVVSDIGTENTTCYHGHFPVRSSKADLSGYYCKLKPGLRQTPLVKTLVITLLVESRISLPNLSWPHVHTELNGAWSQP